MKMTELSFVQGMIRLCGDGWEQGWHERNGGNLTYRLTDAEVAEMYRIFEKDLEIRGRKTGVEVLEFFKTPVTNLSKISKNGKGVRLELVEEKKEGVLLVQSYKIKT